MNRKYIVEMFNHYGVHSIFTTDKPPEEIVNVFEKDMWSYLLIKETETGNEVYKTYGIEKYLKGVSNEE